MTLLSPEGRSHSSLREPNAALVKAIARALFESDMGKMPGARKQLWSAVRGRYNRLAKAALIATAEHFRVHFIRLQTDRPDSP